MRRQRSIVSSNSASVWTEGQSSSSCPGARPDPHPNAGLAWRFTGSSYRDDDLRAVFRTASATSGHALQRADVGIHRPSPFCVLTTPHRREDRYRRRMRTLAVLLGAGASKDADLPTTVELTDAIEKVLAENVVRDEDSGEIREIPTSLNVLRFVKGELLGHEGRHGRSTSAGIDVERLLNAVELLRDRRDLEFSPFVHSWNPKVTRLDPDPPEPVESRNRIDVRDVARVRDALLSDREKDRQNAGDLARALASLVRSGTDSYAYRPENAFRKAHQEINACLFKVLGRFGDTSYLWPLFDIVNMQGSVSIATLNYDLTVEDAAANAGVQITTGFERWAGSGGGWGWDAAPVRLLKLHGSLNWRWTFRHEPGGSSKSYEIVDPDSNESNREGGPALLFGGRSKLTLEGPFMSLLYEFRAHLFAADVLLVIGYSFRDDHVNHVIREWIARSPYNIIIVLDPGIRAAYWRRLNVEAAPFAQELYKSLSLIGDVFPDLDEDRNPDPRSPVRHGEYDRMMIVTKDTKAGLAEAISEAHDESKWRRRLPPAAEAMTS